jgi:hypothetical protein
LVSSNLTLISHCHPVQVPFLSQHSRHVSWDVICSSGCRIRMWFTRLDFTKGSTPKLVTAGLKNAPFVLWETSNGAWAILAFIMYRAFPYDLTSGSIASRGPLSIAFFASRFPIWLVGMLIFYSFWHVTLYGLAFARRPFVSGRKYNPSKVAHNIFWGVSGLAILVCFENVFAFLWATGRLPYEPDADTFGSVAGALR